MNPDPVEQQVRVVIVDTDSRVRQSLAGLICCIGQHVQVVGSASEAGEALRLIERHRPEVVLIDPRLPEVDAGLALIMLLRSKYPTIRVVVMGWSESLENPAFASGATAFIGKSEPPNAFLEVIANLRPPAA